MLMRDLKRGSIPYLLVATGYVLTSAPALSAEPSKSLEPSKKTLIAQGEGDSGQSPSGSITPEKIRTVVELTLRQKWQPVKGPEGPATEVVFRVTANGQVEGLSVKSSAGNQDFDRACVAAIQKTAPLPPLPPYLGVASLPFSATFHSGNQPFVELSLQEGGGQPVGATQSGLMQPSQSALEASAGNINDLNKQMAAMEGKGSEQPAQTIGRPSVPPGAGPSQGSGVQLGSWPPQGSSLPPNTRSPQNFSTISSGKPLGSGGTTGGAENFVPVPDFSETAGATDISQRVLSLNNQAVIAINDSNYEVAIKKLEEALKLDPTYKHARENLAIAYNNYGLQLRSRPLDALKVFHKALALDPSNEKTKTNLETIIQYMGKNPKSFKDRLDLGNKSVASGDLLGGRIEFEAAMAIKPDPIVQAKLQQLLTGGSPSQPPTNQGHAPQGGPVHPGGQSGSPAGKGNAGATTHGAADHKGKGTTTHLEGTGKTSGASDTTGSAGSQLDTMYRNIKSLETKTFGKTFESDDILTRLSRLETKLLGKPQPGKPMRRLDALLLLQ